VETVQENESCVIQFAGLIFLSSWSACCRATHFWRRSFVLRLSKMYEPIKNYKLSRPKKNNVLELFWFLKSRTTLLLFRRASNPRFSLVPRESPTQLECTLSIRQTS